MSKRVWRSTVNPKSDVIDGEGREWKWNESLGVYDRHVSLAGLPFILSLTWEELREIHDTIFLVNDPLFVRVSQPPYSDDSLKREADKYFDRNADLLMNLVFGEDDWGKKEPSESEVDVVGADSPTDERVDYDVWDEVDESEHYSTQYSVRGRFSDVEGFNFGVMQYDDIKDSLYSDNGEIFGGSSIAKNLTAIEPVTIVPVESWEKLQEAESMDEVRSIINLALRWQDIQNAGVKNSIGVAEAYRRGVESEAILNDKTFGELFAEANPVVEDDYCPINQYEEEVEEAVGELKTVGETLRGLFDFVSDSLAVEERDSVSCGFADVFDKREEESCGDPLCVLCFDDSLSEEEIQRIVRNAEEFANFPKIEEECLGCGCPWCRFDPEVVEDYSYHCRECDCGKVGEVEESWDDEDWENGFADDYGCAEYVGTPMYCCPGPETYKDKNVDLSFDSPKKSEYEVNRNQEWSNFLDSTRRVYSAVVDIII